MYKLAWKYWNYLSSDPHNHRASLLLIHLEHYVNGAIMQTGRLERTRKVIDKKLREEIASIRTTKDIPKSRKQDFSLLRLYCDYHFYFTCIGQINKLLKRLVEELRDSDLKSVFDKFKRLFAKDIRDDLEHIDERVIGKKGKDNIKPISDWGNFYGDRLSFAGREYAVNRESLVIPHIM